MPVALFISPHLDDAVFSCGGYAATLADAGWTTVLVTAFTRSVLPVTGFALACQLDKGLTPEVDYMALRRAEDRAAAAILSFAEVRWLDLLEAPHRGYGAPPELFGPILPSDDVQASLAAHLAALHTALQPELVLAPQGLGNHVDHQQVVTAVLECIPSGKIAFYRDTPYAIRQPGAAPLGTVPAGTQSVVPIDGALDRKILAAQAYRSQIGFQFGGPAQLADALRAFAVAEGGGRPAERFCGRALAGTVHSMAA